MPERPRHVPVRIGDQIDLDIEAMADGPDALGRAGGYVVLVEGALVGERVRVEITSAARKFGRGRVRRILRPSADRVDPRCRHAHRCGGCQWQHISDAAQLRLKAERIQKELRRALSGELPDVTEPISPADRFGQRHKVALQLASGPRGEPVPAMHRPRQLELVELVECPTTAPQAWSLATRAIDLLGRLREPVDEPLGQAGVLRSVLVRRAAGTGEQHLVVVATRRPRGLPDLVEEMHRLGATTVSLNLNDGPAGRLLGRTTEVLGGPRRIREQVGDETYLVSPDAFFQTSPHGAAALVRLVRRILQPTRADVVLDCGGGLFALPLARSAGEVVGIEESPVAVGDAQGAVRFAQLDNVRIERGVVERVLGNFGRGGMPRPTLCVMDPPRQGAHPDALRQIARLRPRQIAYVSCDPVALARDLAALQSQGYAVRTVHPVDMFPHTSHVEAVADLSLRSV